MKLLSLSTAEQGASLAVFEEKCLICEEYWSSRKSHSRRLMEMVNHIVINRAGWQLCEIDAFIAAKGPGSFTGIRIGLSLIKGLAFALGKPEAGISSLDGIGWRFRYTDQPICVMMDARKGEVYSAIFKFSDGRLVEKSPERVASPEQVLSDMKILGIGLQSVIFAGSGSKIYRKQINAQSGELAIFACQSMDHVSASSMAQPVFLDDKFFDRPVSLTPNYIRKSDAECDS